MPVTIKGVVQAGYNEPSWGDTLFNTINNFKPLT